MAGQSGVSYDVAWSIPTTAAVAGWANEEVATEWGAYCLAAAAVQADRGLVTIRRAQSRTGADWYVAAPQQNQALDLESALRLEVSGTDLGNEATLLYRLGQKVEQAAEGKSSLPALAVVVGFRARRIIFRDVTNVA